MQDDLKRVEPNTISRWPTVPAGLILAPFSLICIIGSIVIVVAPNVPMSVLTVSLGSIFLGVSVWVYYLSLRSIFLNPKGEKKLISPVGLRVVSLVFIAIPIVSLATGSFWEKPFIHGMMAVAYFGIVVRLWSIAKNRERNA